MKHPLLAKLAELDRDERKCLAVLQDHPEAAAEMRERYARARYWEARRWAPQSTTDLN